MVLLTSILNSNVGSSTHKSERERVFKSGQTVLSTRDGGKTIKPMARVASFMLMETSMMASGKMTRLMESALTVI